MKRTPPERDQITFSLAREFLAEIDAAMRRLRVVNRSHYVRKAILEKLALEGVVLNPALAEPPSTIGKHRLKRKHVRAGGSK